MTYKAFKNHKIVDVFQTPGDCDLTTNVDFAYLKEAMSDLGLPSFVFLGIRILISWIVHTHGPISQADFLIRMGIDVRVETLTQSATDGNRKSEIDKAAKRLVDLTGMGNQYRVLGVTSAIDPSVPSSAGVWPFVKIDNKYS
jgi:NADH dehydrogenase [ubiquinone] 1 alpha subcomplex assembly factor 7